MGWCHVMDTDTMRRIARELYRRADAQLDRGDHDGHLLAGFAQALAGDLASRAIRLDQLEQRRVAALRANTVELPVIVRHPVGDETVIEYRAGGRWPAA